MANTDEKTTPEYEQFRELFTRRMSMRDLRPDPVPDSYVDKILEAGRWAMSGANSQPWEFIVVRDPQVKQALVAAPRSGAPSTRLFITIDMTRANTCRTSRC